MDHLIQRGRDKAGQADDVDLMFAGGIENLLARLHDAEINYIEAVALQDDADDVLADVVHVAFHRRHQDLAVGFGRGVQRFFRLHIRHQVGHRFLHDAGRLDHLRQEHLAVAKQVTDHVHAVHQWPFDDMQRSFALLAGLFGVGFDELVDALDQCVFQTLGDRQGTPGLIFLLLDGAAFLAVTVGQFQQLFRSPVMTGLDDVLDRIAQF